jgi:tetratricopeptide (TPR) repeat protein
MRSGTVALGLVIIGAMVGGCAYYNGLYNANRLAKEAEHAEREGREGDARSLWAQVAVKAESVVARYPQSKHRDDALLLRGKALRAAGDCAQAIEPLTQSLVSSPDSSIRTNSRVLLGLCYYDVTRYQSADSTFTPLTNSDDSSLVALALFWRGRARLALGAYATAAQDLDACSEPQADLQLAVAYTYLERPQAARRALSQVQPGSIDESQLPEVLGTVGAVYPDVAGAAVDDWSRDPHLASEAKGLLQLEDGERWLERNELRTAVARFEQVIVTAPGSRTARTAGVELILAELRLADGVEQLSGMFDRLEGVGLEGEEAARLRYPQLVADLGMAVGALEASRSRGEVAELGGATADLDLFMAAEALRDDWSASTIAAAIFREIPLRFPRSVIAPKALLAAAWVDPARADSLLGALHHDYPSSPYTLAIDGALSEEYTAIEDSLRTLINARRRPTSSR